MQINIKKAVLLAAGRGTRMRELTEALPKPMLEVRGKPVLQHIIEGLRDNGLTSLLIVVGWRADVVKQFLGDGSKLGVQIDYETQTVQDGTGRVVALGGKKVQAIEIAGDWADVRDPEILARLNADL